MVAKKTTKTPGQTFFRTYWADFCVLGLFIIVACIYWFPLPFYLRTAEIEWPVVDPAFNQWIIAWGNHALLHFPWHFFDANMFYPYHNTLAWGDHLFSLTIFAIPLIPFIGVIGAYNVLLLASSALSGFFTYLLAKYVLKNRPAAVVAGLLWSLSYYRATEYGHIQSLSTQWIPLVFLFAEKIRLELNRKNVIWFIIVTFLMLSTNVYLALFTVMAFTLYWLLTIAARQIKLRNILWLGFGWIMAGLLAIPLYLPSIILQLKNPLIRGYDGQASLALNGLLPWPYPGHIIRKLLLLWGYPTADSGYPQTATGTFHTLGLISYPLLLIAIILLIKEWRKWKQHWFYIVLLIVALVSFAAAAGPVVHWSEYVLTVNNWFYKIPYHIIPGYKALRIPMRWFFLGSLAIAVVAGWAWSRVFKNIPTLWHAFLIGTLVVWLIIEQAPAPVPIHAMYQIQDYPVYQWLRAQPDDFAILEVPIYPGVAIHGNDIIEAKRMYLSTFHWKKRVSGAITPYIPDSYIENAKLLNRLGEDQGAIDLLRSWNVKYVIFLPDDYADLGWDASRRDLVKQNLDNTSGLKKEVEFKNATVYKVVPYE